MGNIIKLKWILGRLGAAGIATREVALEIGWPTPPGKTKSAKYI
jgi:hypothetical protein